MDDNLLLARLLDCVDAATRHSDFGWSNRLVRLEDVAAESFELGVLDLDDHPAAYLLGFTAPPSWRVLGVVSHAWAGPLAPPGERQVRPSSHPDAFRVRVTALASRSGARASRLRRPDGTVEDMSDGEGLVPDLLSRALGLSTPPPPVPPQHLLAVRWLERLCAGVVDDLPEPIPPQAGWQLLQRRLAADDSSWNDDYRLTPEDAAWMDTGMLARWTLSEHPPLPVLLRELDEVIGPEAAAWARAEVARFTAGRG